MSRRIDLAGQRFGALTALRPVHPAETRDHRPGWLVKCDCGTEKVVNGSALRRGRVTSCGCAVVRGKRQSDTMLSKGAHEDLTGQTFGELTAIAFVGRNRWRWACSCGRETIAKAASVKRGEIRSCGHLAKDAKLAHIASGVLGHADGTNIHTIRHIMDGRLRANNTTGHTGIKIRRYKAYTVYVASIMVRGKYIYLGQYPTMELAVAARKRAEDEYFAPIIEANKKEGQP